MSKINLRSSVGVLSEIEEIMANVTEDKESIERSRIRLSGCKHAIQIFALSLEYAQFQNIRDKKLPTVELNA